MHIYNIYGSFRFVLVVQKYDLNHGVNGGAQLPIWDLSGPRGSLAVHVGAQLARVGGEPDLKYCLTDFCSETARGPARYVY